MKIAIVAAQFSPEEANGLRRAMATFRHLGTISTFEDKFISGMVRRGYEREFAERCFNQIKGFGDYGFPESHAASFAKLVYVSAWLKKHHPAVFACGLLNAQPMGFYAPAQIVRDARDNGVEVRPPDINRSLWDNRLEPGRDSALALRLGFRQIDGFQKDWADRIETARDRDFASIETVWHKTGLPRSALSALADADGFGSLGLDRRAAGWAVRRLPNTPPLPLFEAATARELAAEPEMDLPQMRLGEHVIADYQTVRLSLKAHPMAVLRPLFEQQHLLTCAQVEARPDGAFVRTAGVVLVRQRPGKGNAIFMTIEDETGIVNAVIWARRFEKYRRQVMGAKLIAIHGRVQKSAEGVTHLMATHLVDRTADLAQLSQSKEPAPPPPRGSEARHPRNVRIIPKSRDFH